MSAVDLFCGVGGLTHGLMAAGVNVTLGVDVDPACRYPYEANNAAKFLEKDVDEIVAADISEQLFRGDYSLLAGCAPCQPFSKYSQASRGRKRADDWRLVRQFGNLVQTLQPDFVTMENVPQLQTHTVYREFLESLAGYHVRTTRVDCARIGVPQSRQRLVLIASRRGSLKVEFPQGGPRQTVREVIGMLPAISAGEQYSQDPLHYSPSLSPLNLRRIKASRPGGTWRDWDPSLRAACHREESGSTYPAVYGRMEWDTVGPTITTQSYGYGSGRFGHPEQDRAISLREAAMLQTFPRHYQFVRTDEAVRFNILGRLIGNAVPVKLGQTIGEVLLQEARLVGGYDALE